MIEFHEDFKFIFDLYIGLMSARVSTGVDGVVVALPTERGSNCRFWGTAHIPFDPNLRAQGFALQQSGVDEIHREALFANAMVEVYAACVAQLQSQLSSQNQALQIQSDRYMVKQSVIDLS